MDCLFAITEIYVLFPCGALLFQLEVFAACISVTGRVSTETTWWAGFGIKKPLISSWWYQFIVFMSAISPRCYILECDVNIHKQCLLASLLSPTLHFLWELFSNDSYLFPFLNKTHTLMYDLLLQYVLLTVFVDN